MIEAKYDIINKLGLHLRAAAQLVQTANRFRCHIEIKKGRQTVNAKSIMGVMSLAAVQGTRLAFKAHGEGEAEALRAIEALIQNKFGEGV